MVAVRFPLTVILTLVPTGAASQQHNVAKQDLTPHMTPHMTPHICGTRLVAIHAILIA
jgi:hypothetical protein